MIKDFCRKFTNDYELIRFKLLGVSIIMIIGCKILW